MMKTILSLVGTAALVVACNSPKAPVEGVTTTGAGVVSNKDVTTRLTNAKCDHAKACNDFGTDKKFKDEAGCKSEVSHDYEDEFKAADCPHGVRKERLDTCLLKMKEEACGTNVSEKIQKHDACRRTALCID
ncbi:MAG: hypothetical protein JWP97_3614 [Labilithrix sp.]|nr:hypothetical protein [Labilithrix sp.]